MQTLPFTPTSEQIARGCAEARTLWSGAHRVRALRGRGKGSLFAVYTQCRAKTAMGLARPSR